MFFEVLSVTYHRVVVQKRLVHARVIGDLLHARAVDAAPDEDLVGGVEDAGLGVGGSLPRRFNHLVSIHWPYCHEIGDFIGSSWDFAVCGCIATVSG
jgi:hypothetical protein